MPFFIDIILKYVYLNLMRANRQITKQTALDVFKEKISGKNVINSVLKKAFAILKESADQGGSFDRLYTAVMYEEGWGVRRDFDKAREYYQAAALQNVASAHNNLGVILLKGKGVAKNEKQAVECFDKAARLGDVEALNNLGFAYFHGHGVDQNYKKAFEYYLRSASQGNVRGKSVVGTMYLHGDGVDQNYEKAFEYLSAVINDNRIEKTERAIALEWLQVLDKRLSRDASADDALKGRVVLVINANRISRRSASSLMHK